MLSAAVAAVLVLVSSLLHGRLHVLVLVHRMGLFLCLCLGWFFAAVAAVRVLVHPLLYGRLHVLVLGHRPPVVLRNMKVSLCGWCFRACPAVPTAFEAAAGALKRATCVVSCAAVFPYSHPFLLAVFHLAMSRRTTGMRYLLCFSSQTVFFMTRKRGRGVLKALTKETIRALTSLFLLGFFMDYVSQCDE